MKSNILFAVTSMLATSFTYASLNVATVAVGDAGNASDSTGFGSVSYSYHIGTTEVTNQQYGAFLNDVAASDPFGLYDTEMAGSFGGISRSGSTGSFVYTVTKPETPVNYVTFWSAARFTNWLTTGTTESGVYMITPVGEATNTITRDSAAYAAGGVAVASRDEWYKAALYSGSDTGADGDGYWTYATQSNTAPSAIDFNSTDSNSANYDGVVGNVTNGGAYSVVLSHYGAFDMNGNLWELNDDIILGESRVMSGGSFDSDLDSITASNNSNINADLALNNVGFRVTSLAAIPEPSFYTAILGGLAILIVAGSRRFGVWRSKRS